MFCTLHSPGCYQRTYCIQKRIALPCYPSTRALNTDDVTNNYLIIIFFHLGISCMSELAGAYMRQSICFLILLWCFDAGISVFVVTAMLLLQLWFPAQFGKIIHIYDDAILHVWLIDFFLCLLIHWFQSNHYTNSHSTYNSQFFKFVSICWKKSFSNLQQQQHSDNKVCH